MNTHILVINTGSSSTEFGVRDAMAMACAHLQRAISGMGDNPTFSVRDRAGVARAGQLPKRALSHEIALAWLFSWLRHHQPGQLVGAERRVVHGDAHFVEPALIKPDAYTALEKLVPLAPLHQPHTLAAIRALMTLQPALSQAACFATAFHRTQDALAQNFALPRELTARGIKR